MASLCNLEIGIHFWNSETAKTSSRLHIFPNCIHTYVYDKIYDTIILHSMHEVRLYCPSVIFFLKLSLACLNSGKYGCWDSRLSVV